MHDKPPTDPGADPVAIALQRERGIAAPGTPLPDLYNDGQLVGALRHALDEVAPLAPPAIGGPACGHQPPSGRYECGAVAGHTGNHVPYGAAGGDDRLRELSWPQDPEPAGNFSCPECAGTGSRPTHRTDCKTGQRDLFIEGLRALAGILEYNPAVPLPTTGTNMPVTWNFWGDDAREQMTSVRRAIPGTWDKHLWDAPESGNSYIDLNGKLAGLRLQIGAYRDAVCTRVVKGTETREVQEIVTPAEMRMVAKEVEVVEWECGSLLAPRPAEAEDGAQ